MQFVILGLMLAFGSIWGSECHCPPPCKCEVGKGCGCKDVSPAISEPHHYLDIELQGEDCFPRSCENQYGYFNPYADRGECYCGWYAWGDWLPDAPPLWRQFAADPRQVTYSVGWRFDDNAIGKNAIPVSFGDYFGLYRWHCAWPYGGDMEIGVEGAVWAVFKPLEESSPLIDADYYVGFPLVYAFDNWQFRLRGYHISTHLGDEFLLDNPGFDRRNPSAEYLDFYGSYYFGDQIRIYAGLGYVVHQDTSFRGKRFFSGLGFEVRPMGLGYYDVRQRLIGHPLFAMHIRGSRDFKHHIDQTYVIGYEWVKLTGLERATRILLEYHDGYSIDGQFVHTASNWFAIRLSYGF